MKSPQNSPKPAETSPYLLGRQAFEAGVSYYACPFEGGERRSDWEWGHYDAEVVAKRKGCEAKLALQKKEPAR